MQKPMKLSQIQLQIEKRIPQTLANSKDVIQKGREYARRSSRARSTRGQENEAWALYKKNHPGCPGLTFLGTDTQLYQSQPPLLEIHLLEGYCSLETNYLFQFTCQNEKKSTKGQPQDTRDGCSQAMKSRFCKNPKDRCFCWFPAAIFLPLNIRHLHGVFIQSFISLGKTFFFANTSYIYQLLFPRCRSVF